MSKFTWNAVIYFSSADEKIKLEKIPVQSFQVSGGVLRTIHLNSARDTDIVLELDDARDHKNLQIFIPPTEGIAVAQFSEAFIMKKKLKMDFYVVSRNGSRWIRAFNLYNENTEILRPPVPVQRAEKRALKIEMSLPQARLQEHSPKGKIAIALKDI